MAWVVLEEIRSTRDALRYGFAVGKVRVLETRTLDRSAYERLLDAPSYREQRRILSETLYGRYLETAETPDDIEVALESALDDSQSLLAEADLPEPIVRFFRLRSDYANLKAALKAQLLGAPLDGLLTGRGGVDVELFEGDLSALPSPLAELAKRFLGENAEGVTLAKIDATIDRAEFAALDEAARDARSPFLQRVAALLSDIANTKVVVRARSAGLPASEVTGMLVPGGTIDSAALMALYAKSPEEMAAGLERMAFLRGVPSEGIAEPGVVDVVTDNALVRLLRTSRTAGTGPEQVIAYVLTREAEVQALRVLLIGKLSGLDQEALRHRLRATYR